MDTVTLLLATAASLVVIWGSMCALNGMCRSSPLVLRVAHVMLAVGALAVLLAPTYQGREPTVAELMLVTGAAVLSFRFVFRRPIQKAYRCFRFVFGAHPKD